MSPMQTIQCRRCHRQFWCDDSDDDADRTDGFAPLSFLCDECFESLTANLSAAAEEH